ncbi:hypothetical protein [Sphingomonas sp. BAUL-RG-20F-R05-02]|uniref:hypothetical protein n=1 Tax=Sphingomonas sp. BAUL-RG-20F-R05-02 TaxID=2914830 RepID=UPI001F5A2D3C|nr:hypothetical protein [Sphingomonas sp. BAUL-RG-20F-R05-02]
MTLSPQQRGVDRFTPQMRNHSDPLAHGLESHSMRSSYTSRRMNLYLGKCETNTSCVLSAWSDGVIASIGGGQKGKASMPHTEVVN